MADNEGLTSDKAGLLTRLQCYEEDLKTECENCVMCMCIILFNIVECMP